MRLVALSTALALSFALSSGTPAAAAPAKKPAAAKTQAAASGPTKQAAAATKKRAWKTTRVASAAVAAYEVVNSDPALPEVRLASYTARPETGARSQPPRMPRLFASSDPVEEARRWIGTNPTDMDRRWCARFMNFVLERSGYSGTGSDAAKSFASYGRRVPGPQIGAIAVMHRGRNGGHVGIVSGIDEKGNPIIISGNSVGRKVAEIPYPRSRIYAYVMPE